MTSTQADFFRRQVSEDNLSLFLDALFLDHGVRPEVFRDGSGIILDARGEVALRYIPIQPNLYLLLLSHRSFKEPADAS